MKLLEHQTLNFVCFTHYICRYTHSATVSQFNGVLLLKEKSKVFKYAKITIKMTDK